MTQVMIAYKIHLSLVSWLLRLPFNSWRSVIHLLLVTERTSKNSSKQKNFYLIL